MNLHNNNYFEFSSFLFSNVIYQRSTLKGWFSWNVIECIKLKFFLNICALLMITVFCISDSELFYLIYDMRTRGIFEIIPRITISGIIAVFKCHIFKYFLSRFWNFVKFSNSFTEICFFFFYTRLDVHACVRVATFLNYYYFR